MSDTNITDGMLDMFLYESEQMLEQLEVITLAKEKETSFDDSSVNEIFRIMHTIKGSSGVMMYTNITTISHKLEDVFYYLRESHPTDVPHQELMGYILDVSDFIRNELEKIKAGAEADGDEKELHGKIDKFLNRLKNNIAGSGSELPPENVYQEPKRFYIPPVSTPDSKFYIIHITYTPEAQMANIRAYTAVYSLKEVAEDILYEPDDIIINESSADVILENGFTIALQTQVDEAEVLRLVDHSAGVDQITIRECTPEEFLYLGKTSDVLTAPQKQSAKKEEAQEEVMPGSYVIAPGQPAPEEPKIEAQAIKVTEAITKATEPTKEKPKDAAKENRAVQSYISVNVTKMDQLMDLIGELVIAESTVLQNPDLKVPGLELSNFLKAAAQLSKITTELQETIMSMRMMPLTNTFQKMNRIVFDVSRKLGKEIDLKIIGAETEVDKNIIENISDPLMHLIRNSVDHGIESKEERVRAGKPPRGEIRLEAKNEGGKVWISVSDDGKGLNKEKLLDKARKNGLLANKNEKDMTDREIYNLITLPGFSTKEQVTEYSGRGVGMDVVVQNIQKVGGSLDIDSTEGLGSTMTLKIPLTLAIIDGVIVKVGNSSFSVPTGTVREFIRIEDKSKLIVEPGGKEFVMIREVCYPLMRLSEFYNLPTKVTELEDGIIVILEHEDKVLCVFVDALIGEQEIVVKPLPKYIKRVRGVSGCTQLGDGSISLILDAASLIMQHI